MKADERGSRPSERDAIIETICRVRDMLGGTPAWNGAQQCLMAVRTMPPIASETRATQIDADLEKHRERYGSGDKEERFSAEAAHRAAHIAASASEAATAWIRQYQKLPVMPPNAEEGFRAGAAWALSTSSAERHGLGVTWLPVRKASLEWLARQTFEDNGGKGAYIAGEAVAMAQLALNEYPEGFTASARRATEPTEAMVDAAIDFAKHDSYLNHPKVRSYNGTANGDSPEAWRRDYLKELCRAIVNATDREVDG